MIHFNRNYLIVSTIQNGSSSIDLNYFDLLMNFIFKFLVFNSIDNAICILKF